VGEFDPEVILLDIGLPVMDGYEVARRLREIGNKARLVALTGYGQAKDVERAREAGFDSHLVKPVELPALVKELSAESAAS
jgi:CheY-like chemotaxis protein